MGSMPCSVNVLVALMDKWNVGQFIKNRVASALGSMRKTYRKERRIMDAFYSANTSRGKPAASQVNCYRGVVKNDMALQLASM